MHLACENIRVSSLFPARDVSRGGTSATQRQKFHTDDAIQCLHNKTSSHGVPDTNLSNFTCLLIDFGKVLCSSANELQQNSNAFSREDYILQIHLTFVDFCLLSVIRKQELKQCNCSLTNQGFWPDSWQILRHQYGISVAESQTFLCAKRPRAPKSEKKRMFSQAIMHRCHTWHDYPWPWVSLTWLLYNLQLDVVPGADFENSLYAFGQSEKR